MHPVHQYARSVVLGKEPAGPHVRNQCKRHLEDRKRKDVAFCNEKADHAIGFFEDVLRHYTAQFAGQKFILHPSQQFIIGSITGWVTKRQGKSPINCFRRFERSYVEEGKGAGKTPLAGGLLIYAAFSEGEEAAENYVVAANKNQANICFTDVVMMVKASPHLRKKAVFVDGEIKPTEIRVPSTKSKIKPLARTIGEAGSGFRPYFVVADEVHEHPNHTIIQTMEEGFKFRNEPHLLMITNSGIDDENSVCYIEHENAVKVASGDITDDKLFTYVCALDEGEDPLVTDRPHEELFKMYKKVNPTLGQVIRFEYLLGRANAARQILGRRNRILRWHFCVWTGAVEAWITKGQWEGIEDPDLTWEDFHGKKVWGGLDLSSRKDLTCFVFIALEKIDDDGLPHFIAWVFSFTPKDALEKREVKEQTNYSAWVRDGHLTAIPGQKIRFKDVAVELVERSFETEFQALAYDQYAFNQFEDSMIQAGGDYIECFNHPQGTTKRANSPLWMEKSIDTFETLIMENRIRVNVNPILRMGVSTVSIYETENGYRRFIKGRKNAKIDAIVAMAMGIGVANESFANEDSSPFDDDDFDLVEQYMK